MIKSNAKFRGPDDNIRCAQNALDFEEETHPNPTFRASIAQAHALVAIAQHLSALVDAVYDNDDDDEPYKTVRIIGGLGNTNHH